MWIKYLPPGKRGASFYIRGRDSTGRFEHSTGARTRGGAETFAERFLAERARRRVPGRGEAVGFDTAAMHYKAASPHLSRVDVRLVDRIARHIGPVDCRVVNHAMLVEAANSLYPRGSNATKNRKVVSPAAAILHYAAAQEWCDDRRFPKFAVSQKSTREAATDETMALLLANCEAPARTRPQGRKADHQVAYKRLLLVMLYELGLRIMDTLRIERGNIDLTTGRVRVRISKTDDWASLELSPVVVSMIANLPGKPAACSRGRPHAASTAG
jgi:integrase